MCMMTVFQNRIREAFPQMELRMEEPLSRHTSFRIGGPAEVMAFPKSVEELSALLKWTCEENIHPAVLGAGTNILASDAGRRGLVICTRGALVGTELLENGEIKAYAGTTMAALATFAAGQGLSGLEFAHGIPGSVGGGLYMNAGAYGGEIRQVAVRTDYLEADGSLHSLYGDAQEFSYRHSAFTGTDRIIVAGYFHLIPKEEEEIRAQMQMLMDKRKASQPLELPSAGSTFKRPAQGYAAALIDGAGLKGFRIGDAAVSEKHAGFVVNLGNATQSQVLELMDAIRAKVQENSGILLEPEVVRF